MNAVLRDEAAFIAVEDEEQVAEPWPLGFDPSSLSAYADLCNLAVLLIKRECKVAPGCSIEHLTDDAMQAREFVDSADSFWILGNCHVPWDRESGLPLQYSECVRIRGKAEITGRNILITAGSEDFARRTRVLIHNNSEYLVLSPVTVVVDERIVEIYGRTYAGWELVDMESAY